MRDGGGDVDIGVVGGPLDLPRGFERRDFAARRRAGGGVRREIVGYRATCFGVQFTSVWVIVL